MLASPQKKSPLSFVLQYLSIFISINIFGILRMISCVRVDFFPTVHNLHGLSLSSGIIQGTVIYHPMGMYCIIQSYPLVHVERVCPTYSSILIVTAK